MRQDIIHWDVFEKAKFVEDLVQRTLPEITKKDLYHLLGRISHFQYTTKKVGLSEKEMLVYDILLQNDLNPATVYKWFCLTMTPEDLHLRIRRGLISQKKALMLSANMKREKQMCISFEILRQGRKIISEVCKIEQ